MVLALCFSITALAGVFIALQISYKWNIPFIKDILKWHVEFGIGLALTGIFHFIWHLSYYGKLLGSTSENPIVSELSKQPLVNIKTNLFITGFVSSSIQLLMMREIMNITGGYELVTGSFLGSWLIGSALGAVIAGKSVLNDTRKINLVFSLSPLVSLILMLFLSRVFLNPGETPSYLAAMIYTFIVLVPFCVVSGFTFIKLITIAGSIEKIIPGKSFSIETTGGILAGISISILTAGLSGTYKLLLLIIMMSFTYVQLTFYLQNSKFKLALKFFTLFLVISMFLLNTDIIFRQILLPAVSVKESIDTPYGNITKGIYRNEESIYYNQRLLAYNNDAAEREEDIHYAMLQSDAPKKIILISGSLKTHLPEIFKYHPDKVTFIERDPYLITEGKVSGDNYTGELKIVNQDAYRYIRNSSESADVIILLLPPPTTLLLNRYYTSEFFSEVKKKLNTDGVFMCTPGPGDIYMNKEYISLSSSVYKSLRANFKNVKPVVGNKLYLIASDKPISIEFCRLISEKKISNVYVSPDYLDDKIILKKSDEVGALINNGKQENKAAFPVASFHSQSYQFSKNIEEKIPSIILMLAAFALPVTLVRRRNLVMYFSALSVAGFEIIILLSLQLMVGNMYQLTGLIIAGLMAGLAVGSGINIRFLNTISLRNIVIFQLVFYILYGLFYNYLIMLKSGIVSVSAIILSGFIPALITGRIFRELNFNIPGLTDTSSVYGADLAGSAFGFIFISGFAVPLFGIQVSLFILSAFVFTGILFGTIKNKS
jgi:spermidine synthase